MRRSLLTLTALLAGSSLVFGQEVVEVTEAAKSPQVAESKGSIEDARKMMSDLREESVAFQKSLTEAKTKEAQMALYQKRPVAGDRSGKVLEIVKGNLEAEKVDQMISWVLMYGTAAEKSEGLDLMLTHFKDSPGLGSYVQRLGYYGPREDIEKVIAKAGSEKVKLAARMQLAAFISQDAERNPELTDEEVAAKNAEVKSLLEGLRDVEGLAESHPEMAKEVANKLFKIENLAIGCVAPEIVGVDHAGEEFKLSDYRGKVTLVDFWGIW